MHHLQLLLRLLGMLVVALLCTRAVAGPINLIYERVENSGAGTEVAVAEFDAFADIIAYSATSTQFSSVDVASTFSIHGATWDGIALRVLFERVMNSGGMTEVAIASFTALGSIISYSAISTLFSTVDVAGTFDVAGLTYDGSQYHLAYERNENSGGGTELAIASFDAFDDLINYSADSTQFSSVDIANTFDVHGFDFDGTLYHLLYERTENSGGGTEVAIASFNSLDEIINYSAIATQFSSVDVAGTFDIAALFSILDFDNGGNGDNGGDPDPVPVPEPAMILLIITGLLALCRLQRR